MKPTKQPFFTVIIPTHNRKEFLKIAVESVLSQTFRDFEIIIVDDGSTDNTKEVLDEYLKGIGAKVKGVGERRSQSHKVTESQDIMSPCHKVTRSQVNSLNSSTRALHYTQYVIPNTKFTHYTLNAIPYTLNIRYYYQHNKGPAVARNKGLREAKGEFICFLDSDDRFRREKLEVTYNYIKKYPGYKIFHTEEIWYRNGMLLPHKSYHKKPEGEVFRNALKICCISISTACIKKEVFEEVGYFDETLPVCEDYDFWLRATAKYPVKLIPKFLTIKEGGHPDQQSKKYPALDRYRVYAIKKLLESGVLNKKQRGIALDELKNKCGIYIQGAMKRGKTKEVEYYKKLLEDSGVCVG